MRDMCLALKTIDIACEGIGHREDRWTEFCQKGTGCSQPPLVFPQILTVRICWQSFTKLSAMLEAGKKSGKRPTEIPNAPATLTPRE